MKTVHTKEHLRKELRRLFRAMDFVGENFLRNGGKQRTRQIHFDIYQGLGLAWEFLGLQCSHWDGYKRTKGGKEACRICGKIKGVREAYCLIPMNGGAKRIGTRVVPNSKKVFENKSKAQLVRDGIVFHGAALNVDVHNSYKSSLFGKEREITIAGDRTVGLKEGGITCSVDEYTVNVETEPRDKRKKPPYGSFPWELSKSKLKLFPVIFHSDDKYRFLGLTIFRPVKKSRHT